MNIHQEEKELLAVYTKCFRNAVDIMGTQHRKFKLSKYIETLQDYQEDDPERCDYQSEQAYERFVAYTYIQGTDKDRSGKLEEDLANHYALGQDMYPTDVASATSMMLN